VAEMNHVMRDAHAGSGMVHKTGGVEHLEKITPQAGPEAPCPPVPCPPVDPNAPMGPAVAVHEPAPGERVVINVVPNQPLIFDFNPLDLKATPGADGDLTLTFPDGAQIVLHQLVGYCGPQPTPFELPDGTVITPSELLHAFNLDAVAACAIGALPEINPTAGPTPIFAPNNGFAHPPYQVGGIGPGIVPLGPLPPTGFGLGAEFLKGVGGSTTTPPTPPTSPPPPPGHFLTVQDLDVQSLHLAGSSTSISISGNYITTDTFNGSPVVQSSPAASISAIHDPGSPPPAFGTAGTLGVPLNGQFGALTIAASGAYSYALSAGSEHTLSQLGTDFLSQSVNTPFNTYQPGFQDVFDITTTNGFDTAGAVPSDIKQLQFDFYAANVNSTPASFGTATPAATTSDLLMTYTDLVDPAHSFQQLVHVAAGGAITVTPESTTVVQPNDPALVSLEYLSGAAVTVSSLTIEGETLNTSGVTLNSTSSHALTGVINPDLSGLGDPGDSGSVSAVTASQDNPGAYTATGAFNDAALSGISGAFGYFFDSASATANAAASGGLANIINYDGGAVSNIALTGSSTANSLNVFEWSSVAHLDATGDTPSVVINGGSGNGLNVLEIESATVQNLDFSSKLSSDPTTGNVKNVEVFDLTDGAHSGNANNITLSANDVFNLANNEPNAIKNAGGAVALWILGNGNDTVNLNGTAWTQISPQVTQVGQAPGGSPSQMVGFTEYAAQTSGAQTVHVYVANAIQAAGHVAHT